MDELTPVRDLRSDAPLPDTSRLAAGRWKLMAAAAAEAEAGPAGTRGWFPPSSRVRRTVLVTATAAAVAAGVVVALPRQSAGSGPQTVAAVFDAAALNAERTVTTKPAPDQWVLHDDAGCSAGCGLDPEWVRGDGAKWTTLNGISHGKPVFETRNVKDLPFNRGSAVHSTRIKPGSGGKVPTPHGKVLTPGGPSSSQTMTWTSAYNSMRFDPIGTFDAFARLPTEPHALLKRLSTDPAFRVIPVGPVLALPAPEALGTHPGKPAPQPRMTPSEQFENILHILENASVLPPRTDAALYRALALIPGTELVRQPVKDALGRVSTAIRMDATSVIESPKEKGRPAVVKTTEHFTYYLYLNPKTYAYQGYRQVSSGKDAIDDNHARKTAATVDASGTVPGGAPWKPYKYPVR